MTAQWLRERLGDLPIALRCNTIAAQLEAAAAGAGVALLPCYLADLDPRLEVVDSVGGGADWSQQLWMVVRGDLRRIARARIVADAIADLLKSRADALAGVAADSR